MFNLLFTLAVIYFGILGGILLLALFFGFLKAVSQLFESAVEAWKGSRE